MRWRWAKEFIYAEDLTLFSKSLMGSDRKLQSWKGTLDSKGLRVNFKGALMQICVCVYIKKNIPQLLDS